MLLTLAMGLGFRVWYGDVAYTRHRKERGGGREIGFRFQALESQGSGIYNFGRAREMRLGMVWVVL